VSRGERTQELFQIKKNQQLIIIQREKSLAFQEESSGIVRHHFRKKKHSVSLEKGLRREADQPSPEIDAFHWGGSTSISQRKETPC